MTDISSLAKPEGSIPAEGVRTRFAPSPTGYMHVGNLRTALYTWLIARHAGGKFILRIEDTDQGRLVEDAVDVIYRTLAECGLDHDEGPDVGGPVGPYIQTERRGLYKQYAEQLVKTGHAYRCLCAKTESEEDSGDFDRGEDPCRALSPEEAEARANAGEPCVIRQRMPREGSTTFHDAVYGDITVENKELEDQILIKSDGLPTYNFATVIDDHLMGITHVVRGAEYLSSAPKYNLLYRSFGWSVPTYVHCPSVMVMDGETGAVRKMSKRRGDPSYEDLIAQGYLTPAVVNYVALLGWSPGGEREIYTLPELAQVFDIHGVSKSPAVFDIQKLTYFNAEYIRALPAEEFAKIAAPWIRKSVHDPDIDCAQIAAILQQRTEKLSDIPEKVDFFDALPEYSPELYIHKKSRTDIPGSLETLRKLLPELEALENWDDKHILALLTGMAEREGVKNAKIMWPLRIAVTGRAVTPGGAVEIVRILGRDKVLARLKAGIEKLS